MASVSEQKRKSASHRHLLELPLEARFSSPTKLLLMNQLAMAGEGRYVDFSVMCPKRIQLQRFFSLSLEQIW